MDARQQNHQYSHNTVSENARAHFGDAYNIYNIAGSQEDAETTCRRSLFLTDPAIDRHGLIDKKGTRAEGTCEWLESDEIYKSWLEDVPGLLWIHGGPGKGKTMLLIHLTQQFELQHNGDVIFFFCGSGDSSRSTSTAVIRALLWQITAKRPELTKLISQHFDPPERIPSLLSTAGSLWELLTILIQDSGFGHMYCLIDGIDECDDQSRRWLVAQFSRLSKANAHGRLHVLIATRHLLDLKSGLLINLDPDNDDKIDSDIAKFTSAKMGELSKQLRLDDDFAISIKDQLLKKAEGTFLWIGYAMNELSAKGTKLEIQEAVNDLPVALPALYDRMLRKIAPKNMQTSAAILQLVALAVRPLMLNELEAAVIWHVSDRTSMQHDFHDYVKICEPFISDLSVRAGEIAFVHQSARDYLLSETPGSDELVESFRIKYAQAQLSLLQTCLAAMGERSALSGYARCHWADHMRLCTEDDQRQVIGTNSFFKTESSVRDEWWLYYRIIAERRHLVRKETAPRLHISCYLDMSVWTDIILTECKSVTSHRDAINRPIEPHRRTSLHYAIMGGGTNVVSMLLAGGADPNFPDTMEATPIWYATMMAQEQNLELLLQNMTQNNQLRDALATPRTIDHRAKISKLARRFFSLKKKSQSMHADDALSGPRVTVLEAESPTIVDASLKPDAAAQKQARNALSTPLTAAVELNHSSIVNLLLDHGADPNCTSATHFHGYNMLQVSTMHNNTAITGALLKRGGNPLAFKLRPFKFFEDKHYVSAFHLACMLGNDELVELFIASETKLGSMVSSRLEVPAGTMLLFVDDRGWRSLPCHSGYKPNIEMQFVDSHHPLASDWSTPWAWYAGAERFKVTGQVSPLSLAVMARLTTTVKLLLARGASVSGRDLRLSAMAGQGETIELLLANGASASGKDVLVLATSNTGLGPLAQKLVENDATLQSMDAITDLFWSAIHEGHYQGVSYALRRGADPNAVREDNRPGLHWAVIYWVRRASGRIASVTEHDQTNHTSTIIHADHASVAKLLLESGADPHVRDAEGKTPEQYADDNRSEVLSRFRTLVRGLREPPNLQLLRTGGASKF